MMETCDVHTVELEVKKHEEPSLARWVPKAKLEEQLNRFSLKEGSPKKTVALGADCTLVARAELL